MTPQHKKSPRSKVNLWQMFMLLLVFAPIYATAQNRTMTKAQSGAKMEALKKLEQNYGISYYLDKYDLAIVLKDELYGVVTLDGRTVVPLEYGYASYEHQADLFILFKEGSGVGCIDRNGKVVIPFEYSSEYLGVEVNYFNNGLMAVERKGKYGIIDKTGRVVVPYIYDNRIDICNAGKELMYVISENYDTTWLLRFNGDTVMGPMNEMYTVAKGLIYVKKDTLCGIYNIDGKEIIPIQYDGAVMLDDGRVMVHKNGVGYGVLDSDGHTLVPCSENRWKGEHSFIIKSGLVVNYRNDKCGILDFNGNVIIPHGDRFFYGDTKERIALVDENYRMEIYDIKGNLLEHFETTYSFDENVYSGLPVSRNGKWGFVDKNLNLVIQPRYKELYQIDDEHCSVLLDDGQRAIVDFNGKILVKGPYDSFESLCDGIYRADGFVLNGKDAKKKYISGLIDLYGQTTFSNEELTAMQNNLSQKK